MLMIIFGAGASYDSYLRRLPHDGDQFMTDEKMELRPAGIRPPLANQLFSEDLYGDQIAHHPGCDALFARLRPAATQKTCAIEQLLDLIQEEARYPHIGRVLLELRNYLQEVLDYATKEWNNYTKGVTNYAPLLDEVEKWRHDNNQTVCLVTFNYDTLLEQACGNVLRLEFPDLPSYIAYSSYKLFKLHGSINWGRHVRHVRGGLKWTDTYSNDKTTLIAQPETYKPAIAIPTITKSGFECPPSHLEALEAALPDVTHLLVIGWRGMEEQFLKLWADTHPKAMQRIQIVNGSQSGADAVRDRLESIGIGLDPQLPRLLHYYGKGFSNFLVEKQLERFLA